MTVDALLGQVCEYNVPFGKKNRGVSVVTSHKLLVQAPKEEDVQTARILGWCVEWVSTVASLHLLSMQAFRCKC